MKEPQNGQSKPLLMPNGIYNRTRASSEPVFAAEIGAAAGMTDDASNAAWRYLSDRGLILTFSIPGTARIDAEGSNAIEGARRQPDQSIDGFPRVTYNIVNNTANIGTAINSPAQQACTQSTQRSRFAGRAFTTDTAENI